MGTVNKHPWESSIGMESSQPFWALHWCYTPNNMAISKDSVYWSMFDNLQVIDHIWSPEFDLGLESENQDG